MATLLRLIALCILWNMSLYSDTFSISTSPPTLTISSATAGQQPTSVTNSTTNYNFTTLGTIRNIVGSIDSNMPSFVTLTVQLAATAGSTSAGAVAMTAIDQTLITNIPRFRTATGLTITYVLSATLQAAPTALSTRTLTLTLQ